MAAKPHKPRTIRFAVPGLSPHVADSSSASTSASLTPVRYRKEILRVGDWRHPGGKWKVTPTVLNRLAVNFGLAKDRGVSVPLVWNHSTDARDTIGEVQSLEVSGRDLIAHLSVPDGEASKRLGTVNNEVSVEVTEDWQDGLGNVYDIMLTHVGVVNLPVVPGQQPFQRLSLIRSESVSGTAKTARTRRLATEDEGEGEGTGDAATQMAVSEVVTLINETYGAAIPAEVDTIKELRIALQMMNGGAKEEEPEPEESSEAVEAVMDEIPAEIAQMSLATLRKVHVKTRKQLATIQVNQANEARAAFTDKVESLLSEGKILPAERKQVMADGEAARWRLSILRGYERSASHTEGQGLAAKRLATGAAPAVGKDPVEAMKKEQDRVRQVFGIAGKGN